MESREMEFGKAESGKMEFGKAEWETFEQGTRREWLLTNGIGGFASSTVIGANTRRYHGLLVASLDPPAERRLILSKIDESAEIAGKVFNLYSFKTPDYIMKGYRNLQRFVLDPLPAFIYSVEDVFIEKRITMVYGENTVAVIYHIINGADSLTLKLTPLINFRDYHQNSSRAHMSFERQSTGNSVNIIPYGLDTHITLHCDEGGFFKEDGCWFYNMEYPAECERGLYALEDHYIPGYYEIHAAPGEEKYITVIVTVEKVLNETDGLLLIKREEDRLGKLVIKAGNKLAAKAGDINGFASKLIRAADNFIVQRKSTGSKTIVAGYPWFTDWGRDAMIALPGLTLATGRFEDAREILLTFSRYMKNGLIPNLFPDNGGEPAYNSADASLWYIEAVCKYIEYTGDYAFVHENLYWVIKEIIGSYMKGTLFDIKMDTDCLISSGDAQTQLTWMDAKIGGVAVTPRYGKAVEINALWYNALMFLSDLAYKFKESSEVVTSYENLAAEAKKSFTMLFWNEDAQCLYDVVAKDFKDASIRPNQIFAVSLANSIVEGEKARKIVRKVWKELYTSYGIRSLSPGSDKYTGIYTGDQAKRDAAYHQGTAWAWLTGHFITAYIKVNGYSKESGKTAGMFIKPFKDHLRDGCLGSISEIFDGDEPLTPKGCFAQAWSVGEVLRAYMILCIGHSERDESQDVVFVDGKE